MALAAVLLTAMGCDVLHQPSTTRRPGASHGGALSTPRPVRSTTTVDVPATIDATGTADVAAELQAFLDRVPDGTTVRFPRGGTFRISRGIELTGGADLVLEGNGATLRLEGHERSVLALVRCAAVVVRDLTIAGDNVDAGTVDSYHPDGEEFSHGIAIQGSDDVEVSDVHITGVWGDGVFIAAPGRDYADWSQTVWIHDSTIERNGRMGVVINAGRNVVVEGVELDAIAISAFDIEPDVVAEGAMDVTIRDNAIGTYGHTDRFYAYLLEASGVDGSTAQGITLAGNVVSGGPGGYDGRALGIHTLIDVRRSSDVVVTNNTGTQPADASDFSGAVLAFSHVDGLTVTGNVQPLASGRLLRVRDSTDVADE